MPGDLNLKKSWNPALMKNQQKVWEQEQKSLDEIKRIRQLEAEFQQEQETTKLLSLKNKNNLKVTKEDKLKISKMSWMYDNPNQANDTKTETKTEGQKVKSQTKSASKLSSLDPMASIARGIRSSQKPSGTSKSDYRVTKSSYAKYGNTKPKDKAKVQREIEASDPMDSKVSTTKTNYLKKFNY